MTQPDQEDDAADASRGLLALRTAPAGGCSPAAFSGRPWPGSRDGTHGLSLPSDKRRPDRP